MNISVSKFEDMNLYSNRNIEKLASTIVAQSSNAALVNMYEDAAILLDHQSGEFYMANYKFDVKKAQFIFEDFEPITLFRENTSFRDSVYNFFESEEATVSDLVEDFKDTVLNQDKFIDELVAEAMLSKDFDDVIDYSELKELNEGVEVKNEAWFKKYKERLMTHPLTEAKYFNWKDPVAVSLVETETHKILNSSAKEKAHSLWKNLEFKKGFSDAAKSFVEDVETGIEKFKTLFESYPQIFYLDKADKKTVFGKIIINDAELRESRSDLLKGIDVMFENDDSVKELEAQYIAEGFEDGTSTDYTDDSGKTAPTAKDKNEMDAKQTEEDKPEELSAEDLEKLSKQLASLAKKIKDEKLQKKVEDIAGKLEVGMEEGTRPDLVKEAVAILSL